MNFLGINEQKQLLCLINLIDLQLTYIFEEFPELLRKFDEVIWNKIFFVCLLNLLISNPKVFLSFVSQQECYFVVHKLAKGILGVYVWL